MKRVQSAHRAPMASGYRLDLGEGLAAALLGPLVGIGPGFTQGVRVVTERGKGAQLALGDLADFICTVVQKLALD